MNITKLSPSIRTVMDPTGICSCAISFGLFLGLLRIGVSLLCSKKLHVTRACLYKYMTTRMTETDDLKHGPFVPDVMESTPI